MSFSNTTRVFTIQPASTSFDVWCKGAKFTKRAAETVTLPNTSGIYYIYYDVYGVLQYKTTFFTLSQDAPVAYIYWNATDGVEYFFADERHGITMDWATHEYLHLTRGAALSSGLSLQSFTTTGTGSASTDATVSLANGIFYDEDIPIAITHSATPVANSWQQRLQGGAYIPVYYKTDTGIWKADTATQYPLKFSTLANYNQLSGTWSATALANNKFGIYWIVATNNLSEPILSIMGQDQYNPVGAAEAALWSDMDLSGLPIVEFRTLYKLVYKTANAYGNAVKSRLVSATDFRASASMVSGSVASPPQDHGFLSGLSDDDHTQYHTDDRGDARYLQLTGGTLSGTLNGTAAVFSGNVSGASAGFGPMTLTGNLSGTTAAFSSTTGPQLQVGASSGGTNTYALWNAAGVAPPRTATARSDGTKIVLYPNYILNTAVDYAIGIDTLTQWYSVPQGVSVPGFGDYQFKWYAGTTQKMNLNAVNGRLTVTPINTASATAPSISSAGDLYYDTTLSSLMFYAGGAWRQLSSTWTADTAATMTGMATGYSLSVRYMLTMQGIAWRCQFSGTKDGTAGSVGISLPSGITGGGGFTQIGSGQITGTGVVLVQLATAATSVTCFSTAAGANFGASATIAATRINGFWEWQ